MGNSFNYARIDLGLVGEYAIWATRNFAKKNDKFAQIEGRHALNGILHELMCGANEQQCQELEQAASLLI